MYFIAIGIPTSSVRKDFTIEFIFPLFSFVTFGCDVQYGYYERKSSQSSFSFGNCLMFGNIYTI